MAVATSKNMTIGGCISIAIGVGFAVLDVINGRPIDFEKVGPFIATGLFGIMGKGQENTGGTVPSSQEAVSRVLRDTTPPFGFARPWTLVVLAAASVLGCAALSGTSSSTTVTTGPNGTSECVTFTPPITISGMSCTGECASYAPDGKVTWRLDCVPSGASDSKALVLKQAN